MFIDVDNLSTDPVIDLGMVAKWLKSSKFILSRTLRESYKKDIDYTITTAPNPNRKKYGNNYKRILVTPDAFKNICMLSRSTNAQKVRDYFIDVENTFQRYRNEINAVLTADLRRMENNQRPLPSGGPGWIYIIKASEGKDSVYKLGRTKDLKRRMQEHNSSHADDVEIVFQYRTDNVEAVETCTKAWLKELKYRKFKEVYQVDESIIRQIINKCIEVGATKEYALKKKSKLNGGYYMITVRENE
jgi:phage anti-repressor protein/predicted GIY-YIG superfamily endonuclease